MREARGPAWTDWLREQRRRRARPGSTRARSSLHLRERGRDAGARSSPATASVDEALDAVRAQPSMDGRGARRRASRRREPYVFAERRPACASRSSTTAPSARSCAGSPARAPRSRSSRTTSTPTSSPATTASLLSNGPGDPEPLDDEVGDRARAARPRAGARHLPRPPAARRSRPATRRSSCRSATAARTTRCSSARTGRVLVTSQNHGFAVAPTDDARGDARLALRRHGRGLRLPGAARALGAVPSGGRARARTTRWPILETWVEEVRLAAARRHRVDLPDRLRARS